MFVLFDVINCREFLLPTMLKRYTRTYTSTKLLKVISVDPFARIVLISTEEQNARPIYIFVHHPMARVKGPQVHLVGETRLPFGHVPLLLYSGELTIQTSSGSTQVQLLDTHLFIQRERQLSTDLAQVHCRIFFIQSWSSGPFLFF